MDFARVQVCRDPANHVAWPAEEAERLLDIVERELPALKQAVDHYEDLTALQDDQIHTLRRALVVTGSSASDWAEIASHWRHEAKHLEPSGLERILRAPELWLVVGLAFGAVGATLLAR